MSNVLPDCATCPCGRFWTWQEDAPRHVIVLTCRHCGRSEDRPDSRLLWTRVYQNRQPRSIYRFEHAWHDPTLPRAPVDCAQCHQAQVRYHHDGPRFVYHCLACHHQWVGYPS